MRQKIKTLRVRDQTGGSSPILSNPFLPLIKYEKQKHNVGTKPFPHGFQASVKFFSHIGRTSSTSLVCVRVYRGWVGAIFKVQSTAGVCNKEYGRMEMAVLDLRIA